MKTKRYFLTLTVVTAIFLVPALGQIEPEPESLLIGRANPTLADIDNLHVTIIHPDDKPGGLVWENLKAQIETKINKAGMKVFSPKPGVMYKLPAWPELVIRVDIIKLEQSKQYVFHIQTSLARMVHLGKKTSPTFKTDVWKTEPVMQAASMQDAPEAITKIVLQQTDTFITACLDAKQKDYKDVHTNQTGISQKEAARASAAEEPAESVYIASKSSKVFHKSTCNWAKRIKPENLVHYKTREDAVNDGKRPCKTCNP